MWRMLSIAVLLHVGKLPQEPFTSAQAATTKTARQLNVLFLLLAGKVHGVVPQKHTFEADTPFEDVRCRQEFLQG